MRLLPILMSCSTYSSLFSLCLFYSAFLTSRQVREADAGEGGICDPPRHNPKGRPRTACLTGALEGCPRGGGPVTRKRTRVDDSYEREPPVKR